MLATSRSTSKGSHDVVRRRRHMDHEALARVVPMRGEGVRRRTHAGLDGRDRVALLIVVLASLLIGVVHVPQHDRLSPYDEYVYSDYLSKVPQQLTVKQGERTGEYARSVVACRPPRMVNEKPPPDNCRYSTVPNLDNDEAWVLGGKTSADFYTPLYFVTTWAVSEPLRLVGVDDPLTRGRLAGALWLALAAGVLLLTLRRLGVGRRGAVGAVLLMVGSTPAYWANTFVTTDGPTLLIGAGVLWALVSVMQGGLARRWFVLLAVVATLTKFQNLSVIALASFVLMLTAWTELSASRAEASRRSGIVAWFKDSRVVTALVAPMVAVAAQLVWLVLHKAMAIGDPPVQGIDTAPTIKLILGDAMSFFPGALGLTVTDPEGDFTSLIIWVTVAVAVAGVGGMLLASRRGSFEETLAISTLLAAVIAPLALALVVVAYSGAYIPSTVRYGMVLVPIFFACAALLSRSKRLSSTILLALGVLVYGLSLTIPG